MHSIYKSEENANVQLCLQNGYFFLESHLPDPWYKDDVFNFRHVDVNSVEAKTLNVPHNCVRAHMVIHHIRLESNTLFMLVDGQDSREGWYF